MTLFKGKLEGFSQQNTIPNSNKQTTNIIFEILCLSITGRILGHFTGRVHELGCALESFFHKNISKGYLFLQDLLDFSVFEQSAYLPTCLLVCLSKCLSGYLCGLFFSLSLQDQLKLVFFCFFLTLPLPFCFAFYPFLLPLFLVACTRLYKSLCWSVRPSVCHTVEF